MTKLTWRVSQILDILIDVNESQRMPAKHFELNSPLLSKLELNVFGEPRAAHQSTIPGLSLSSLSRQATHTPYSLPSPSILPADLLDLNNSPPPAYLTPDEEEAYLTAIDTSLAAMPPTDNLPADVEIVQAIPRPRDRTMPTEKDFAIHNPVSVHNWLRKYQPRVFDGKDKDSERAKSPAAKGKKKDKMAKHDPLTEGLDDEFTHDLAAENGGIGSAKGKRKGEDDAYRPKGGHKRPAKRKREVDDIEGKMGKKIKKVGTTGWEDDS